HAREIIPLEVAPLQRERSTAGQREGEYRIQARRIEQRVAPLEKRRRSRQGDEMRDVTVQRMQLEHGVVARLAANVHVLAEHRELLGKITVERGHLLEARLGKNLARGPALERM